MVKEVPHHRAGTQPSGGEGYVSGRTQRSQEELLQKHNLGDSGDILIGYHNMLELLSGKYRSEGGGGKKITSS